MNAASEEKGRALAGLFADLEEKTGQIKNLSSAIQEMTRQVANLTAGNEEKTGQIASLSAANEEKTAQIQNLTKTIQTQPKKTTSRQITTVQAPGSPCWVYNPVNRTYSGMQPRRCQTEPVATL